MNQYVASPMSEGFHLGPQAGCGCRLSLQNFYPEIQVVSSRKLLTQSRLEVTCCACWFNHVCMFNLVPSASMLARARDFSNLQRTRMQGSFISVSCCCIVVCVILVCVFVSFFWNLGVQVWMEDCLSVFSTYDPTTWNLANAPKRLRDWRLLVGLCFLLRDRICCMHSKLTKRGEANAGDSSACHE